MLNLVLSGGWEEKKQKTKTKTTDRPSLKKAVEGNQTIFFLVLHLKCLCSHSFRYTWHLFREPGGAESYRGWL